MRVSSRSTARSPPQALLACGLERLASEIRAMNIDGRFDVVGAASAARLFHARSTPTRVAHGYLVHGAGRRRQKNVRAPLRAIAVLCETPKTTLLGYCGACTVLHALRRSHASRFRRSPKGRSRSVAMAVAPLRRPANFPRANSCANFRSTAIAAVTASCLLGDVAFATHEAANASAAFLRRTTFRRHRRAHDVRARNAARDGSLALHRDSPSARSRRSDDRERARYERVWRRPTPVQAAERRARQHNVRARAVLDRRRLRRPRRRRSAGSQAAVTRRTARTPTFLAARRPQPEREPKSARSSAELIEVVRVGAARLGGALARCGDGMCRYSPRINARLLSRFPQREVRAPSSRCSAPIGDVERIARTNVSAGLVVDYLRMQLAPVAVNR